MRGVLVAAMVRALRQSMQETGATTLDGLAPEDLALLRDAPLEPKPWYPYEQYLRLLAVSYARLCGRDLGKLREFGMRGVGPVYATGYERLLVRGDPARTLDAVSILWRSCHDFGSAYAQTDATGTTIHVIDYPDVGELDGNINAGWFFGMARLAGAEVSRLELRRSPWLGQGDEQEVRLDWRLPEQAGADDERHEHSASEDQGRYAQTG